MKQVKEAATALAELYVFETVVAILEGSTAPRSTFGQKAAAKIIGECQKQQQRYLREYDKHVAAALAGKEGAK